MPISNSIRQKIENTETWRATEKTGKQPRVRITSGGTSAPLGLSKFMWGIFSKAEGPWLEELPAPWASERSTAPWIASSPVALLPSRDRQGAELAWNRRAGWNHSGFRSLTVAARVLLIIYITMHEITDLKRRPLWTTLVSVFETFPHGQRSDGALCATTGSQTWCRWASRRWRRRRGADGRRPGSRARGQTPATCGTAGSCPDRPRT
jgi:hypothetical protein